jgi:hypothetical protein
MAASSALLSRVEREIHRPEELAESSTPTPAATAAVAAVPCSTGRPGEAGSCHLRARGGRAPESSVTPVAPHRRPGLDPQRSECREPKVACSLFPSASRAARLATRHAVPRSISRKPQPSISRKPQPRSISRKPQPLLGKCCGKAPQPWGWGLIINLFFL